MIVWEKTHRFMVLSSLIQQATNVRSYCFNLVYNMYLELLEN